MSSRLVGQPSAYLRSAAHQPVDWHPWGPDPFERARRERKPLLLDIGAVWCHWCHVMDGESYEDPRIAEVLNRDWICIKLDRDERPDVDARYQRAVQALVGQGGWPLTAFLTPEGEVFYGGTYFPPDGKYGRPGFLAVLTELARIYREEPDRAASQAQRIRQHLEATAAEAAPGGVSEGLLDEATGAMARLFDFRHGGFGTQPKFPHPGACELLLARWFDTREASLKEMVDRTLLAMARGGIYDQVGGGFHRYSVDERWIVPHFEKMSYDNSELLRAYVHAAGATTEAVEYRWVIEGIADWVATVLAQPQGGYAASQDADVGPGDDGDYFTWTPNEVRAVVSEDECTALARHYDIDDAGEMHHHPGKNVLWVKQSPSEIAAATGWAEARVHQLLVSGRAKLRAARAHRKAPYVDTTVYTGWSAMMASAMLDAAALLGRPDLERQALDALERIFREAALREGAGGVRHALSPEATFILEDQVQVASAALDALEATGDWRWLKRALALGEHAWSEYAAEDGSLYDLPKGGTAAVWTAGLLAHRLKPVQDAPAPSGNGVAAILAARLAEHTGDGRWRTRLEAGLGAVAGGLAGLSLHGATLLRAVDWFLHPAAHVVVVGAPTDPVARELTLAARRTYRPRKIITRLAPHDSKDALAAPLRAMLDGAHPRAYLCAGQACTAPTADPAELAGILAEFAVSPHA